MNRFMNVGEMAKFGTSTRKLGILVFAIVMTVTGSAYGSSESLVCPEHSNAWPCLRMTFDGEAYDGPMKFGLGHVVIGASTEVFWISAQGTITENTAKEFEQFVNDLQSEGSYIGSDTVVHLNSPGGDLLGGLQLGRLIRKYGFSTDIDLTKFWAYQLGEDELVQAETFPGVCASACAYAFLGGVRREFDTEDVYAVHQFYDPVAVLDPSIQVSKAYALSDAQVLSGMVSQYVYAMTGDVELFYLASITDSSDANSKILLLSPKEAQAAGAIRTSKRSKFKLAFSNSGEGVTFLDSKADTGIAMSITCSPNDITFHYSGMNDHFRETEPMSIHATVDGTGDTFEFEGGFPAVFEFPYPKTKPDYLRIKVLITTQQWESIAGLQFDSWLFGRLGSTAMLELMPKLDAEEEQLSRILRQTCLER